MTLKRDLIVAGTFIAVSLFALNALAESYTVRGTVTSVEPRYATKTVTEPVQKCWTEEVPVYGQGKNNDSSVFGMDLEGAIIGGILGNNVVKGDNAGAAGAIIGGLIGSDMKNKKNQEITGYRQVSKCNTQYNERTEEYLAGYSISYEALGLRGVMSSTRSRNVGESIDVNVQISAY
tara:strand:+ start:701 stop:1231 length:531 start_codon:yes stop_codon:yes gene_type:complete